MAVTKILSLDGLNDMRSAELVEKLAAAIPGVESAHLDFLSQKLSLEINGDPVKTVTDVTSALERTMPDITIGRKNVSNIPAEETGWSSKDLFEQQGQENQKKEKEKRPEKPKQSHAMKEALGKAVLEFIYLAAAAVVFGGTFLLKKPNETVDFVMKLIAFLITAAYILPTAFMNAKRCHALGASLTTIGCLILFFLGRRNEAVVSMLILDFCMILLTWIRARFHARAENLIDICPETVQVNQEGAIASVPLSEVKVSDQIYIQPGETLPIDGIITDGEAEIDVSLRNGDTHPHEVKTGNPVHAGDILVRGGPLTVEVKILPADTEAFWKLERLKGINGETESEQKCERATRLFMVGALFIAMLVCVLPVVLQIEDLQPWIYRAALVLVIASPCGIAVTATTSFLASMVGIVRRGISVKDTATMEKATKVKTVLMGLAGTLMEDSYIVTKVETAGVTERELIELAAQAECISGHPLARAIMERYRKDFGNKEIDQSRLAQQEILPGYGVRAMVDRRLVMVGGAKMMKDLEVEIPRNISNDVTVYVAVRGTYVGALVMRNALKPGARNLVSQLQNLGITKTALLTGCDEAVGQNMARTLGISEAFTELDLAQKAEAELAALGLENAPPLAFIGTAEDLTLMEGADIGISMGGAANCTDFVIGSRKLADIPFALKACHRAIRNSKSLPVLLIVQKVILGILCAAGVLTMYWTVIANAFLALLLLFVATQAAIE